MANDFKLKKYANMLPVNKPRNKMRANKKIIIKNNIFKKVADEKNLF